MAEEEKEENIVFFLICTVLEQISQGLHKSVNR